MKFLGKTAGLVVAVLFVFFAIANRDAVDISFSPLPFGLTVPIYLLVLGGAVIGAMLGGFGTWRRGSSVRRAAQERKREIARLESEVAAAHQRRRAANQSQMDNGAGSDALVASRG